MPKPGCRDCRTAQAMFKADDLEGGGDPLEWAETHLFFHDRRRKNWRKSKRGGR